MTRFAFDTLSIHGAGMTAAVTLRGVGSAGYSLGRQTAGPNSGALYDEARFVLETDDEFEFGEVLALEQLLTTISPLIGKCITDDATHPGVTFYGAKLDRCGTAGRGASATHASVTAKLAHLLITQFGAGKNQLATATLRCINMLKAGDSQPTAVVYNASLPATYIADEAFTLGPATIGGIAIPADELVSVQVETGINVQVVKNLRGTPANVLVLKAQPRIRVSVEDGSLLDAAKIPYGGLACAHANTTFWFAALQPGGSQYAYASAEHIKVTAAGTAYLERTLAGGGGASAGASLVIETNQGAGGTAPLVITTGVAIT